MNFISVLWKNVTIQTIPHSFEESRIVASNESGTHEESAAEDLENVNGMVIFDFDDYIPENTATCETKIVHCN